MTKNSTLVVKAFNNLSAKEQDAVLKKLIKFNVTKKAKIAISIPQIRKNLKSLNTGSAIKQTGIMNRESHGIILGPLNDASVLKTEISLGQLNSTKDRKTFK